MAVDFNTIQKNLGSKFYYYVENRLSVFRIVEIASATDVKIVYDDEPDKLYTIKMQEILDKQCHKLTPDGIIAFSIVEAIGASKDHTSIDDVMVCAWIRNKDGIMSETPSVICRQNVNDVFYTPFMKDENDIKVGISVTEKTCPAEINFKDILACVKVNKSITYNIYIGDTLDDILSHLKKKLFDRTLDLNLTEHLKYIGKLNGGDIAKLKPGVKEVDGFCIDLETLLKENNFWYDVETELNITPLNIKLNIDEENQLSQEDIHILSDIFKIKISRAIALEYKHDIDLSKINMPYVLIRDTEKIYVVGYLSDGEYISTDIVNSSDSGEAIYESLSKLAYNKEKYN